MHAETPTTEKPTTKIGEHKEKEEKGAVSQPDRFFRCARVVSILVKHMSTKCLSCLNSIEIKQWTYTDAMHCMSAATSSNTKMALAAVQTYSSSEMTVWSTNGLRSPLDMLGMISSLLLTVSNISWPLSFRMVIY